MITIDKLGGVRAHEPERIAQVLRDRPRGAMPRQVDAKVMIIAADRGAFAADADPMAMSDRSDGGKMIMRIDLDDPGTIRTIEACSRAVDKLASQRCMAMVEPFISRRVFGNVRSVLTPRLRHPFDRDRLRPGAHGGLHRAQAGVRA